MVLTVLNPGILTTLQGSARHGQRHYGIPASGPADPLSMALANRLVGNAPDTAALEITFGGAQFEFDQDTVFSITGAAQEAILAGAPIPPHQTLRARRGDTLAFLHPPAGVRTYLAIPGGFRADDMFGSRSTFTPASFGGYAGRALKAGDTLEPAEVSAGFADLVTPQSLRPHMVHSHSLRALPGPDFDSVGPSVWPESFQTTHRMDRTGIELAGPWPKPEDGAQRPSAALFTGAVQLTPSGNAYVLLPDAQTTGGYPHVLQVIRADRHLLGQVAPGDRVRFLSRSVDEASRDLKAKTAYFASWLSGFSF